MPNYEVRTLHYVTDDRIAEFLSDGYEIIWQHCYMDTSGERPLLVQIVRFQRVVEKTPEQIDAEQWALWKELDKERYADTQRLEAVEVNG